MALYTQQSLIDYIDAGNAFPLNHARIGHNSLTLDGGTVSASTSAAGFEAANLSNGLTYARWKPVSVSAWVKVVATTETAASYMGVAGHTLGTNGCTVKAQGSSNGTTWSDLSADISPVDDSPIMFLFAPATYTQFRLLISSGNPPVIGAFYVGATLDMMRPVYGNVIPMELSRVTKQYPRKAVSGQFLGQSKVREGVKGSITWKNLNDAWYRENFDPLAEHAIDDPYFIAWNPLRSPDAAAFVWTNDDVSPSPQGQRDLFSVTLPMEGHGSGVSN